MSAHSKRKKTQHHVPNTKLPITYHLYIEDIGDIQFRIDINSNSTFRTILKKILHQILSLSPERNGIEKAAADQYHLIANSFPKLNKSQSHHPLLHLTIAPKMIEANNTFIEQYAQQLWSANTPSIALNGRYYRQCIKARLYKSSTDNKSSSVKALYILVSKPSSSNTTNSMNTNTNTSDIEIDDDDESLSQENINSNNNRNLNRNDNRKRKPSKPKPKKTRKKKKRKQRRYESDSDYEYSSTDGMSQDEDDDFKCNIYNELRSRHDDSDDFIPPVPKKRKLNIKNMKKKLVKRNPTRRHNPSPIYNNNNTRRTISRHQQFKPRPRPRIPLRRNKNKVNRQGSKPNHLIILLDASRSMTSPLHYALDGEVAVSRLSMAVKYIKKYIQIKWNTEFQKETLISLATFGEDLSVKENTRRCTPQSIKALMGYLVDLRKEDELYDGLETETAVYQLLDKLMDMIRLGRMSRYKNTRILMFTDGENVSHAPLYGPIKNTLKYKEITIDCIQTSRGERDNVALKRICTQYSHQGRFWNPLTIADWNTIFESVDFLFPYRRDFVYDLTLDDSEDADD